MAAVFKDLILKDNESFKSKNNLKKYPLKYAKSLWSFEEDSYENKEILASKTLL